MDPEPISAILGGSLIGAATVRRAVGRYSIRRRLWEALRDPVPGTRVAAVQTAGENGLGRNARMLLAVAAKEEDLWVRQVLAQTIVRHRWEPATSRSLIELRLWAKQELMWIRLESGGGDRAGGAVRAIGSGTVGEGTVGGGADERSADEIGSGTATVAGAVGGTGTGSSSGTAGEAPSMAGNAWWEA